jgi:hypothetical protein
VAGSGAVAFKMKVAGAAGAMVVGLRLQAAIYTLFGIS